MTTNEPIGKIEVTFEQNGDMRLDISGKVNYVQIYGVAALLHEQARQQHALQAAGAIQQGLQVARAIPGGLHG